MTGPLHGFKRLCYLQPNDHHSYLKSLKLLPNQSDEIEDKIAEYHKALK